MDRHYPTFSIVTPSFNQGKYLEATINSVLSQEGDFCIDYVIMDGGSTDGSVDIIRRYDRLLGSGEFPVKCRGINFRWRSEKDGGQYDAINRGFELSTGEIMAWINSDDLYLPAALKTIAMVFARFAEVHWVTANATRIDKDGMITDVQTLALYPRTLVARGVFNGRAAPFIQQESTFWRRSLWERIGGNLAASYRYAADFDLWCKFACLTELVKIRTQVGLFRNHGEQKTSDVSGYNREVDTMATVSIGDRIGMKVTKLFRQIYLLERVSLLHRTALTVYYSHEEGEWLLRRVRGRVA